ncbi:phospholipid-transporting ATPase VD-like [Leuresthes tenuis]|uniref:phospholipid-transporting ATPase VD-like n=1 Tax=Leuresthes tenuis TaxID=355514 RepID=UPI003B50DEC1
MNSLERLPRIHPAKERLRRKRTVVPSFSEDEELKQQLESHKTNKIRTTKYSLLSFLPKNLFEQLHRFANVYFIFLAALNFVPVVEAFQAEVSLIPIVLVLSVTAIKDIFEDYRRFNSDRLINKLPCRVYSRWVLTSAPSPALRAQQPPSNMIKPSDTAGSSRSERTHELTLND